MLVQAMLVSDAIQQSASDPAQSAAVKRAIRAGAKSVGFDLDTVTLTTSGLAPATSARRR